ncbi:MAG TPA: tripartite tricarboxylate transporter substrate binding protein [Burkholderiales bacterium]|nr:tripartite tricarboxylate transporter substrate binding protein [Burkholderiales bacterium]
MKCLFKCLIACSAAALAALTFNALAQPAATTGKWPDKPVRVVVPFAAGGSTDIIARVIAARLTQEFGQQFIIDNRGGAGGSTGAEIALRANPDGYTLIIVATSYATNAALYPLNYDPVKNITPVGQLHSGPFLLALNNSVAASSTKEFIELLRAKPGAYNFGSSGIGGATHLATELFKQMTNTNATHVPYKGDAPAVADLIGGQVQFILSSVPALIQHVKGGKAKALAVTTPKRWPELPELPAVAETVPGYEHTSWNGMWGPAGMPKEIVNRLNTTLARLLKLPDVQERLKADGRAPAHTSPEEFARIIEREIGKWRKVVKAGNIKVN